MVSFTSFVNLGVDSSDDSSVLATSLDSEGYTQDVNIDDDASIVGEMSNAKIEIPAVGCGGSNCDTDDELDTPKRKKRKKGGHKSGGDVRKRTRTSDKPKNGDKSSSDIHKRTRTSYKPTTKVSDAPPARGGDAPKAKVGENQGKGSDKKNSGAMMIGKFLAVSFCKLPVLLKRIPLSVCNKI